MKGNGGKWDCLSVPVEDSGSRTRSPLQAPVRVLNMTAHDQGGVRSSTVTYVVSQMTSPPPPPPPSPCRLLHDGSMHDIHTHARTHADRLPHTRTTRLTSDVHVSQSNNYCPVSEVKPHLTSTSTHLRLFCQSL